MNKLIQLVLVVGVAVCSLATVNNVKAQERYRTLVLSNAFIGTPYAPMGATNSVSTTNNATITAGGYPIRVADCQNIPTTIYAQVANPLGGTNGTTILGIDLSPDDSASAGSTDWNSNVVSITVTTLGASTNWAKLEIPVIGGTNAFTNMKWARWGSDATLASNQVTILQFYIQNYR